MTDPRWETFFETLYFDTLEAEKIARSLQADFEAMEAQNREYAEALARWGTLGLTVDEAARARDAYPFVALRRVKGETE